MTASGEPFPHRDLILFLTFSVILVTIVGQGLLLPGVIRWLGLAQQGRAEREREAVDELELRLIEAEREQLYALLCSGGLEDETRLRIERELDLREAQLLRSTPRSGNHDV